MEPATRFVYGPEAAMAVLATAYAITVNNAWVEVAYGMFYWFACGLALMAILDGGAWWITYRDAKRHTSKEDLIIAGRVDSAIGYKARRAA